MEDSVLYRLPFLRFLGVDLGDDVPDSNTIRLFPEALIETDLVERLLRAFDDLLTCVGPIIRSVSCPGATIQ